MKRDVGHIGRAFLAYPDHKRHPRKDSRMKGNEAIYRKRRKRGEYRPMLTVEVGWKVTEGV